MRIPTKEPTPISVTVQELADGRVAVTCDRTTFGVIGSLILAQITGEELDQRTASVVKMVASERIEVYLDQMDAFSKASMEAEQ